MRRAPRFEDRSSQRWVEPAQRILSAVAEIGGMMDADSALEKIQIEPLAFWGHVKLLEKSGRLIIGERIEKGSLHFYLILTSKAYIGPSKKHSVKLEA